ncbi:MAG: LexA family transcriptional regulator [Bacteroidales bacterium]|jgi:transcriptional regulator with XRE-family HTH domain|nr:LexA family transcriptional regulator [Bacteroidales bacterium]
MYLASNIKLLRKRKKITQNDLAASLNCSRSGINNYENGTAMPPANTLILLSDLFHISIDTLLRTDLSRFRESQLKMIETGTDVFIKGSELRVLATTVNNKNEDNVELVSVRAKAGYTTGYYDPGFIAGLPVFRLPFLSGEKKYRTFQISGDSMLPIPDKSWVTGEYVQDLNSIKNEGLYIVLTLNEGIVFKKVRNELKEKGGFRMISLNPEYEPYDLPANEIRELWKFVHYIAEEIPIHSGYDRLYQQNTIIKNEVREIKDLINHQLFNKE